MSAAFAASDLRYVIFVPSGDQFGFVSERRSNEPPELVLVRFVWLDPLASITKISWLDGLSRFEPKTIFEPSGDQEAVRSLSAWLEICVWLDPSASITKTSVPHSEYPARCESKRIFEPSGDQAGLFAVPPLGETWTWLDPSEFITQISLDLTKTIFELSGDQDGYL
jgi:hypothetical protein